MRRLADVLAGDLESPAMMVAATGRLPIAHYRCKKPPERDGTANGTTGARCDVLGSIGRQHHHDGGVTSDLRHLMDLAIAEAGAAPTHGDVPVGAVVAIGGRVVAQRHNQREDLGDPTAHAEILALADAARHLGTWRLAEATVVVTLEPCPMCAGALLAARVRRLVYGAADPKAGACGSLYNLCADPRLNHEVEVVAGVAADDCGRLLTSFFGDRRGGQGAANTVVRTGPGRIGGHRVGDAGYTDRSDPKR